uniref:Neurotransmitter-gated ion-channel ligand-binding domain-containing protein n=1 Tax=Romanomermis culicivorax TaxID=13658 RepID=A0A915IL36_ROMCU
MSGFCHLFLLTVTISALMVNCQKPSSENDIIRILLTNYNDPYTPDVKPVNVGIETFILSNPVLLNRGTSGEPMLEIDNMWIIQRWRDRRLNFETFYPERNNIRLPHEHISKVWTPQISSINDKKFEIRRSPTPNIYLFIFENGTVNLSFRAAVQLPCRTDCQENEIRCRLTFESGNYNIEQVRLNWANDQLFVDAGGDQYDQTQKWSVNRTVLSKETNEFSLGKYDYLEATFVLKPNLKRCEIEL